MRPTRVVHEKVSDLTRLFMKEHVHRLRKQRGEQSYLRVQPQPLPRGWRGHGAVTARGSALQGAGEGHR